jgi:hypothetical protein
LLLPSPVSAPSVTYRKWNGLNLARTKKKKTKIRSFGRSKNQILNATVSGTVIITANGRRYGGAGRWIESIAAESIVEIAQDVESSEEE